MTEFKYSGLMDAKEQMGDSYSDFCLFIKDKLRKKNLKPIIGLTLVISKQRIDYNFLQLSIIGWEVFHQGCITEIQKKLLKSHIDEIGDCVSEIEFFYPETCKSIILKYDKAISNLWKILTND